jgi:putative autoinducer-2 (AI-2) aldolase
VPIVIAGGKKIPEQEALQMAYDALQAGAIGVDMGRNVFQSSDPVGMIKAVNAVVHNKYKPKEAFDVFKSNKK